MAEPNGHDAWSSGDPQPVLFVNIAPSSLDGFFRLRLAQVLRFEPPLAVLSIVVLGFDPDGAKLAGGFAGRFRSGWPFAQCVFVTEGGDAAEMSMRLGLPVRDMSAEPPPDGQAASIDAAPEILRSEAGASQKIALQLQRIWGRCGSTTGFENQLESLVGAGFLTIRVFTDAVQRHGATLNVRMRQIVSENSVNAGAHVNVLAVPDGPPVSIRTKNPDAAWATWLAATASCRIRDPMVAEAAKRADSVIANHLEGIGPALALAPQARLLLDIHDDRALATRESVLRAGKSEAEARISEAPAARVQAGVLAIPDICCHASRTEFERLGSQSQRAAMLLPRVHVDLPPRVAPDGFMERFDVLVVGDEQPSNIASLRWFLNEVWQPFLAPEAVSVAIAGRVGNHVRDSAGSSPWVRVLGFIDDLDAVRRACRLTVVPDRHGTGIAVKMLATLAAGHPMVSTPAGLRGLDPAISRLLPADDDPRAFAADILALLRDPDRMAERRRLVEQTELAIHRGPDHAALLRVPPRPTPRVRAERQARWQNLTAAAIKADPRPYHFGSDEAFPMSGSAVDGQVLVDGWHGPEDWGRWTDGAEASLRMTLPAPAMERLTLRLDLVPSPVGASLVLGIDNVRLPEIVPVRGPVEWHIPHALTRGKTSFLVTLHVGETMCPADAGASPDTRVLGVGVSAVCLRPCSLALYEPGEYRPLGAHAATDELLRAGWHKPEAWGCWSNCPSATLELSMREPPRGRMLLELDIAPSPMLAMLTVGINGHKLAAIAPLDGGNQWLLPASVTDGQKCLLITLSVSGGGFLSGRDGRMGEDFLADGRFLGIGLRGLTAIDLGTQSG